ncbi:MAG: hypothetical protein KBE16_03370 [Alphaproteobacteria bacterium]|nr:hypothetical protein [Alphaproteobacteria bacterium]MBP9878300.1 hypothetical protein [Alphaproteobacteria bacterium]
MPIAKTLPVTSTEVRLAEEKLQKYNVENTQAGMRRLYFGQKFENLSAVQHQLKEFDIVQSSTLHAVVRDFTLHVIQDTKDLFTRGNHRDSDLDNCLKDLQFAMVLLDREKVKGNGFVAAFKSFLQNLVDHIKGRHVSESDLYQAYADFAVKVDEIKLSGGSLELYTKWMQFFKDLGVVMTKDGYKVKNEGSVAKVIGNKPLVEKPKNVLFAEEPDVVQPSHHHPEKFVKGKRVRKYEIEE